MVRELTAAMQEQSFDRGRWNVETQLNLGMNSFAELWVRATRNPRGQNRGVVVEHSRDFLRENLVTGHMNN